MTKQDGKAILFMTCSILQIFVQQTVGEIGCLTRDGRETCWPTISYLCSCRSVRIFPCVLWMWHDSDPNPNRERWRVLDPRCLEARREGDTGMLEEELCLGSRGRSGSDLLVPTPDPRWSRSGRCVHTWRITHSNHGTQMRWSPNAKLETNVWWFSLASE